MHEGAFSNFVLGDVPTWMEKRIIDAAAAGVSGTSGSLSSIDEAVLERVTRCDVRQDHVSAALIRALATNQFCHPDWPYWTLHTSDLEIEHAVIEGELEWIGTAVERSLSFWDCTFLENVTIYESRVNGSLTFHRCIIPRYLTLDKTKVCGGVSVRDCTWPKTELDQQKLRDSAAIQQQLRGLIHASSSENDAEDDISEVGLLEEVVTQIRSSPVAERDRVTQRIAITLADRLTNEKLHFDLSNGFHLDLFLKGIEAERVEIMGSGYRSVQVNDASILGDVAVSAKISGVADFTDALIGRDLDLRALESALSSGGSANDFALILRGSKVARRLSMPKEKLGASTDLSHANCGLLDDLEAGWPVGDRNIRLHLNGLSYFRIEQPDGGDVLSGVSARKMAETRVKWLLCQPDVHLRSGFNPQPWKEAAAALSTDGYEQAAKLLTIRRRVAERHSASTPRIQKLVNLLLHWVADYGFNPWKTVTFCVASIVMFAGVFAWADASCATDTLCTSQGGLFLKARFGDIDPTFVGEFYPRFGPLEFSLGTFVPLFELASESFWRVNTRAELALGGEVSGISLPVGAVLYWIYVFERILGGVMVAIAVTGFTGMLARDP